MKEEAFCHPPTLRQRLFLSSRDLQHRCRPVLSGTITGRYGLQRASGRLTSPERILDGDEA